jgi:ABC-type nickel/cobalt efflux system permease component RcnA
VENLSKVRKDPEFQQKILTNLGELEGIERRWLAGILAGIIVGANSLLILLQHLPDVLNGQPIVLSLAQFIVLVVTIAALLAMSVVAFAEYFSLSLSFHFNVGRGMVIRKRTGPKRTDGENDG